MYTNKMSGIRSSESVSNDDGNNNADNNGYDHKVYANDNSS